MVCTLLKSSVHCRGRVQQHASVRLPFVISLHFAVRPRLPVVRSATVDQPSTEAITEAAPATAEVSADAASAAAPTTRVARVVGVGEIRHPKMMKIGKKTNVGAAARYIIESLQSIEPWESLLITTLGKETKAQALKAIARAGTFFQETDSSSVITFQMRWRPVTVRHMMTPDVDNIAVTTEFYVQKAVAQDFAAELPVGSSPMNSRRESTVAQVVGHLRQTASYADKEDRSKPICQYLVSGGVEQMHVVLTGILQASKKITAAAKHDIKYRITVSAIDNSLQHQQWQRQQAENAEIDAASSVSAAEPAAVSDADAPAAAAAIRDSRNMYTISVYLREPRPASLRSSSQRSSAIGRRVRPSQTKPDIVEVPADEWAQIKQQLEMVPHLTQQLQIMTQQHEQLLSLLAAQQQRQQ